jgi:hypothetical protein
MGAVRAACCWIALCVSSAACGGAETIDDSRRDRESGAGGGAGHEASLEGAGGSAGSVEASAAAGGAPSAPSTGAVGGAGGGSGKLCEPGKPCGGINNCSDTCFTDQCCALICWCESGALECNLHC